MKVLVASIGHAAEDNATSHGAREDSASGGNREGPVSAQTAMVRDPNEMPLMRDQTTSNRLATQRIAFVGVRATTF